MSKAKKKAVPPATETQMNLQGIPAKQSPHLGSSGRRTIYRRSHAELVASIGKTTGPSNTNWRRR